MELKSLPEIGKPQGQQLWSYLKGSKYKLALLVNFGTLDVSFKRIVYESLRSSELSQHMSAQIEDEYILNLIDTPGHIDFSYEVSRALRAVEGSILLVDATQGVQAQTLTTLGMARDSGLKIIPVISKIDSPLARVSDVKEEVVKLLGCNSSEILEVSGRTGEGVENLLQEIITNTEKRDALQQYLKENGIASLIHYPIPPHLQQAYSHLNYKKGDFPIAEKIADTCLSLPVWPGMTREMVSYVSEKIKAFK